MLLKKGGDGMKTVREFIRENTHLTHLVLFCEGNALGRMHVVDVAEQYGQYRYLSTTVDTGKSALIFIAR